MIVFKTFLKVLNKCKTPIIMYTVFLLFFSVFNMRTSGSSLSFVASKPDILIINEDEEAGITESLVKYLEKNSNIIEIDEDEDAIRDALFYRDVNCIIYIPENFRKDFLDKKNPEVRIKSTGDYQASLAELLLERYLKTANSYNETVGSEEELLKMLDATLSKQVDTELASKLDTGSLEKAGFYYNFTNYCILAGSIYVICLILSSFKNEGIRKRTMVSSMDYKAYNRKLLLSNSLFAAAMWLFYVILSFPLLGKIMFTRHGLVYIVNSFIFSFCALTIAFLIGNLVEEKNAINGIVNVIALGSSFLCGAFVPMEWLPAAVLKIAHILPSYWYIKTNEMMKGIETVNMETMKPVFINMAVILGFSLLFITAANVISAKKRRLG